MAHAPHILLTCGVAIWTLNTECVKVNAWIKDWADTPVERQMKIFSSLLSREEKQWYLVVLCCENPAYVLYQLSPYNHAAKTPSASRVIYLSILYVFKLNNAKFLSNLELQNCKLLNSSAWRPSWFPFSSQTSSVVAHSSLIDLSSVNKHDCDQTKKICKRLFRVTFDA